MVRSVEAKSLETQGTTRCVNSASSMELPICIHDITSNKVTLLFLGLHNLLFQLHQFLPVIPIFPVALWLYCCTASRDAG